ncbi:hypothetical protein EW026_g3332 [Hermanssonia centrifuga]|uniref:O-methyltransferase C-terminal domain-containing protein n=1 Tax=Hermanssonia centrifuga TaxID=98765 RepID=A0A4V3XAU3_9APHY|nr:hypothetical protein EW026_g3332 [Hermanssonia centrifuga]
MAVELTQLRGIIVGTIDAILDACKREGKDFPKLDVPAEPAEFLPDGIRNDSQVLDAITLGVAAASQLIATLQPPAMTLYTSATRGMHIRDIVKLNGTDAVKLGRILRYLATNHIFSEVEPDVFANNMISSLLDTGKVISAIQSDPVGKFDNTNGLTAWISFIADDCMKSAAYLSDTMTDPKTAHSQDPNETSIQKAFRFEGTRWEFLERPENLFMFRRYGAAMSGAAKLQPPWAVLTSYEWNTLPKGAVFVDVGSGLGNFSLEVAKIRPDLTYILEDRPPVMEKAKKYWEEQAPSISAAGNIHFIGHDFFNPQPQLPAMPDVFFMRTILHDWSDEFAVRILTNLRHAAKPDTKLLIIDTLVEYACSAQDSSALDVPGYELQDAPKPLLANLGFASIASYDLDMVMLNNLNARERTIGGFLHLLSSSGWRLVAVRKNPGNKMWWPMIIAVPA